MSKEICLICQCKAESIAWSDGIKLKQADIEWYRGVTALSEDYFSNRGIELIFSCHKHIKESIVRYLMLRKLNE